MINVKIIGHDYRYEVYQIVSLFYDKSEILFSSVEEDCDLYSILDVQNGYVECKIKKPLGDISKVIKVDINDKKDVKNSIKRTLLICLKEYTGIDIPWGILVGIRPTKIVHDDFKKGMLEKDIVHHLEDYYGVSKGKTQLAMEVADREAKYLDVRDRHIGLYVGIPFCPTRCIYCSFTSNPVVGNEKIVEQYVSNLVKEIDSCMSYAVDNNIKFDTFYIGGGTPTALNAKQMDLVLKSLGKYIDFNSLREFTIEAGRPDSIDLDKLEVMKSYGCSRISINPQSMNDVTLDRIGRKHTVKDVIDKFKLAREVGFDNINMDIIVGLPGESIDNINITMEEIRRLNPDSVTIHTMAVKRASKLNEIQYTCGNSDVITMYKNAVNELRGMGMYPYYMYRQKNMVSPLENVGYCRSGKEGVYNIQMIAENISILALGADAVSKIVYKNENRIERIANLKDVREYNSRIDEVVQNKMIGIDMIIESMK